MKKFKFIIDGSKYEVSVNEIEENIAEIEVNGTPFTVEIEKEQRISLATPRSSVKHTAAPVAKPAAAASTVVIKSPLPGSIMKVLVAPGQTVKRGDVLLTMESMKMENNILAEFDGVIKTVSVEPGKNVLQDDKLIEMESSGTSAAPVSTPAPKVETPKPAPVAAPSAPKTVVGGFKVNSPLPGSVLKVVVTEGQSVKRGDVLLTLESMKMENNILAEKDAVVKSIAVAVGQSVMQDELRLILE